MEFTTEINDSLKLKQISSGLKFGTDALLLAAFIRRMPTKDAVEYGAGSGVISLLHAVRNKFRAVTAVEIQPEYAALIRKNAEENGLDGKVSAVCGDIREYRTEADVIFSNPPYMKATSGYRNTDDGKFIARHEVCGDIGDFCASAARNLKYGGLFYVVYRPDRLTDLLTALRENRLEPKRILFAAATAVHAPSLVLIEAKKGAAPGAKLLPLLCLTKPDGSDTDEMKRIYETGDYTDD